MKSKLGRSVWLLLAAIFVRSTNGVTDCTRRFRLCETAYQSTRKDLTQVNDYYQCLKRPQGCDIFEEENRERSIRELKIYVAKVCPTCRFGPYRDESPPEEDKERCEDQMFACTLENEVKTSRYSMLYEVFDCVQRPASCSGHEEYLRHALSTSIVNEMADTCADCLVPNVGPAPEAALMVQPEDLSCGTVSVLCNGIFNVKERAYRSYEWLYYCLAKMPECDNDLDRSIRQQQMVVLEKTMDIMCPNCSTLTPPPPAPKTCLEQVYHCSTYNDDRNDTLGYRTLLKVHGCLTDITVCEPEDHFQFYLLREVRAEMRRDWADCPLPSMTSSDNVTMAQALRPRPSTCGAVFTTCHAVFNIRPRGAMRYREIFDCVSSAQVCTRSEMETHYGMASDLTMEMDGEYGDDPDPQTAAMAAFGKVSNMRVQSTEAGPCRADIENCWHEFQRSGQEAGDRLLYLDCLFTPVQCDLEVERMRSQFISDQVEHLKNEIRSHNGTNKTLSVLPAHPPPPPPPGKPSQATPAGQVTGTATAPDCSAVFQQCESQAPGAQSRNFETMYKCVRQDLNCTATHLMDIVQPSASRQVTDASQEPPANPSIEISQCVEEVAKCELTFRRSNETCQDRLDLVDCLSTHAHCPENDDFTRRLHVSDQLDTIQKDCISSCHQEKTSPLHLSVSCEPSFALCKTQYNSNKTTKATAQRLYECLLDLQGCTHQEEEGRKHLLFTTLLYLETGVRSRAARTAAASSVTLVGLLPSLTFVIRKLLH